MYKIVSSKCPHRIYSIFMSVTADKSDVELFKVSVIGFVTFTEFLTSSSFCNISSPEEGGMSRLINLEGVVCNQQGKITASDYGKVTGQVNLVNKNQTNHGTEVCKIKDKFGCHQWYILGRSSLCCVWWGLGGEGLWWLQKLYVRDRW